MSSTARSLGARRGTIRSAGVTAMATVVISPLALWALAGPAAAAGCPSAPGKCYLVSISPTTFTSGASVPFTISVTNESPSQTLGSVNVTVPAAYSVTSYDHPSTGNLSVNGSTFELRNLNLAVNGGTVTLALTADTTDGSNLWLSAAKQSNDFNGVGNDFVLDPSSSVTTTGSPNSNSCPTGYVSCGTNFINFSQPSQVSTGQRATAAEWLVGTAYFPATNATGGTRYSMKAPSNPGNYCPSSATSGLSSVSKCTFEMDMDVVPKPYDAAHSVRLVLECDVTVCKPASAGLGTAGTGFVNIVKIGDNGKETLLSRCSSPGAGSLCYDTGLAVDGNFTVTVHGITAGDPKFAGTCYDGCYPSVL